MSRTFKGIKSTFDNPTNWSPYANIHPKTHRIEPEIMHKYDLKFDIDGLSVPHRFVKESARPDPSK